MRIVAKYYTEMFELTQEQPVLLHHTTRHVVVHWFSSSAAGSTVWV
jgi:hypothetical protein